MNNNKLETIRWLVIGRAEVFKINLDSMGLKRKPINKWPSYMQEEYYELYKDFARFKILDSLRDGKKS